VSRSRQQRCEDIRAALAAIARYYPELRGSRSDVAHDAIVRQLEIVGEASNRLDGEAKSMAPEIEWYKITGFRNIAAHEYFRMNQSIVEGIVVNYLPALQAAVARIAEQGEQVP
jgi:uncharacterized protein with HEPN domain